VIGVGEVVLFGLVGFLVGTATGLVPGLHVNNAALIFVSSVPLLASVSVPVEGIEVILVAASVSHTFFDIVPSVLVGAPEPSTALTVLPGHRLLMEGRAEEAVRLSALGSGGAVALSLVLVVPVKDVFVEIYDALLPFIGWVLLIIAAVMVVSEEGEAGVFEVASGRNAFGAKFWATVVLVLSGVLGYVALRGSSLGAVSSLFGPEVSVLFPVLTGLFGSSTLLLSLATGSVPPEQSSEVEGLPWDEVSRSIFGGTLSGTLVGWFPGVTSAQAAVLAEQLSGGDVGGESSRIYLVSVSAVNSANAVFTLVALYAIGRTRSGVTAALSDLVQVSDWRGGLPPLLAAALLGASVSALLSFLVLSKESARLISVLTSFDYRYVSVAVLGALAAASLVFTGVFGFQVLLVGTFVGVLPPLLGVRRTHCMGCLLLPVAGYFFGLR